MKWSVSISCCKSDHITFGIQEYLKILGTKGRKLPGLLRIRNCRQYRQKAQAFPLVRPVVRPASVNTEAWTRFLLSLLISASETVRGWPLSLGSDYETIFIPLKQLQWRLIFLRNWIIFLVKSFSFNLTVSYLALLCLVWRLCFASLLLRFRDNRTQVLTVNSWLKYLPKHPLCLGGINYCGAPLCKLKENQGAEEILFCL